MSPMSVSVFPRWLCVYTFFICNLAPTTLLLLLGTTTTTNAQEDPKEVYLWWEHKDEHGHLDLIDRLKAYSATIEQPSSSSSPLSNPLIEAFEATNTHAFVILGPHSSRHDNIRNFSEQLGFTESGGKYLTKIDTVL
jgi:hypothetical protein